MDLLEAIHGRRSIRRYKSQPVGDQEIRKIIEAANWAPSACNTQGWRFIVIDDRQIIEDLVKLDTAYFVKDALQGILVLYDNRTDNLEYADYIQSASAAIQNMLLTAHSMGIGTCWICHLPRKAEIRRYFEIPSRYDPVALITLGYYESVPVTVKRKHSVDEIISRNRFDFDDKTKDDAKNWLHAKRAARRIYYLLPAFLRQSMGSVAKRFEKRFD